MYFSDLNDIFSFEHAKHKKKDSHYIFKQFISNQIRMETYKRESRKSTLRKSQYSKKVKLFDAHGGLNRKHKKRPDKPSFSFIVHKQSPTKPGKPKIVMYYKYHKGFTNAVKKKPTMKQFLSNC